MSNWKATLPRKLPEEGTSNFVFSFNTSDGCRIELKGNLDTKLVRQALCRLSRKTESKSIKIN